MGRVDGRGCGGGGGLCFPLSAPSFLPTYSFSLSKAKDDGRTLHVHPSACSSTEALAPPHREKPHLFDRKVGKFPEFRKPAEARGHPARMQEMGSPSEQHVPLRP